MSLTIHREGQEDILKDYFQGQAAHATFYLGLAYTNGVGYAETDGLADITGEFSGNGYARVAITANSTNFVVALDGTDGRFYATCDGDFEAAGGDWANNADTWFICTSADGSGKLVVSGLRGKPRSMTNGTSLNQEVYVGLDNPAA